jgi:hypothetical protein
MESGRSIRLHGINSWLLKEVVEWAFVIWSFLTRHSWPDKRGDQFPESLCARLLKGKYYANWELVDMVFPTDVSQTWRSIACGLELLKKGIIWRVGLGSKIQNWRDLWIEQGPSRMLSLKHGRSWLRWVSQPKKKIPGHQKFRRLPENMEFQEFR